MRWTREEFIYYTLNDDTILIDIIISVIKSAPRGYGIDTDWKDMVIISKWDDIKLYLVKHDDGLGLMLLTRLVTKDQPRRPHR